MKHLLLAATALLGFAAVTAFADDPPRTHVDTTVVGSDASVNSSVQTPSTIVDVHHFEAGAPELLKLTSQLHLSPQQQAQLNDAVERADAGAATLIKRERDLAEMIAASTPQDPLYGKLVAEQAASESRWTDNREGLRRDVIALLSPAQRARFEDLQGSH